MPALSQPDTRAGCLLPTIRSHFSETDILLTKQDLKVFSSFLPPFYPFCLSLNVLDYVWHTRLPLMNAASRFIALGRREHSGALCVRNGGQLTGKWLPV